VCCTWRNHVFGLCPSSVPPPPPKKARSFENWICFRHKVIWGGHLFCWVPRLRLSLSKRPNMVPPSFYLEFGNRFSFRNVFLQTFDDGQIPKTWFFKMYLPAERLLDSPQCLLHTIAPRDITPHEFLVTAFVYLSDCRGKYKPRVEAHARRSDSCTMRR
jgi:hypothetical protein